MFVAVAIGYGFEEERGRPIEIPLNVTPPDTLGGITLDRIPIEALITGFRLDPRLGPTVFPDEQLPPGFGSKLFQRVKPPEEISFLFSIVDSATGRELQDEPTHNLASLGKSNGERPFRLLAQPIMFQPRSTIRLQVIEQSEIEQQQGVPGPTLFIVLYGYKIAYSGLSRAARQDGAWFACLCARNDRYPFSATCSLRLCGKAGTHRPTQEYRGGGGSDQCGRRLCSYSLGYGLAVAERNVLVQPVVETGILKFGTLNGELKREGTPVLSPVQGPYAKHSA